MYKKSFLLAVCSLLLAACVESNSRYEDHYQSSGSYPYPDEVTSGYNRDYHSRHHKKEKQVYTSAPSAPTVVDQNNGYGSSAN